MKNTKQSVPKNVILDLLPVYLAGEASTDSERLVEQYAKDDKEVAQLIRAGKLPPELFPSQTAAAEDLGIKTLKKIQKSIRRQMLYVALVTTCVLLVPFVAMFFSDEVNWSGFDFLVAGILLLGSGLAFVLIANGSKKISYRFAAGIAVFSGLLLAWANLAVGIIGTENNVSNRLYLMVFVVAFGGAALSRLKAMGMAYTLFVVSGVQFLIPFVAMLLRINHAEELITIQIIVLNSIFALAFAFSAILFRHAAQQA